MIEKIFAWFSAAVPRPVESSMRVQLGVHAEEFKEMLDTLKASNLRGKIRLTIARWAVGVMATELKQGKIDLRVDNRVEFLDACADQIVTATGCAYMNGMDIVTAIQRVNDSNWSKFVNGKPLFDENGKVRKGPGYFKPTLIDLV